MFRTGHAVSRAVHAIALVFAVAVVVSLSSASAATPVALPAIAAIRMGGDNYAQTHLPQYATVFLGAARTGRPRATSGSTARGRAFCMYNNVEYLDETCGNPTPVTCPTAVSFGEALAHDQAYPGDRWILRDSSGQPDHLQGLPGRGATPIVGLGLLSVAGAQQRPRSLTAHAGLERRPVRPRRPRTTTTRPGRRSTALAPSPTYPTNASWYPAMKALLRRDRLLPAPAGLLRRRQRRRRRRYRRRARRRPGGRSRPRLQRVHQEYFEQHGFDGSLAYNGRPSTAATTTIACASSTSPRPRQGLLRRHVYDG